MKPGPQMGEILNQMLERVLDDPDLNTKEALLALLPELLLPFINFTDLYQ